MKSKILLGEIRNSVGDDIYFGWVEEARAAYDSGMKVAKHNDLNGHSVSRQPRTAYIGQCVSKRYSEFIGSRPAPNQSIQSSLEQAVSEA